MNIGNVVKSVFTGMPALMTGGHPWYRAGEEKLAWERFTSPPTISVASDVFADGQPIPVKYSADGESISPFLLWWGVADSARSYTLVVEDPDAPTPDPFVHWLVYNIPFQLKSLPEDIAAEKLAALADGAMQGKNSSLKIGWAGMAPPNGDMPHRYFFQLFALDRYLPLDPGAGRSALFDAMAGHVIGRGKLMGTYSRT